MDRGWAEYRYTNEFFENLKDGCAGLRLHRVKNDLVEHVATVTYWDAMGQFFIETNNTDVPVEIIQELISETTATIKTR